MLLLFCSSSFVFAGVSGPTSDTDGRYTLNISAPSSAGSLQFQSHYLSVYRNNTFHKSVSLSRTATSFTDVVDQEGQWRYDQFANFRQCTYYIGRDCGEWDEVTANVGSHTVTVSFAQSPPPDTGLPNKISGPPNSISGQFSLTFRPPTPGSNLIVRGQRIRAYRGSTLVDTFYPSTTATSHSVSFSADGSYRFDHIANADFCSIWVREECLEWEQVVFDGGSHTTEVRILSAPGTPSSLSVPSVNRGLFTASWGISSGRVSKYYLDYRKGSGAWNNKYGGTARSSAFSGSLLSEGSWELRVSACDEAFGQSRCSSSRTATTTVAYLPPRPSSISPPSATNLAMSWAGSTTHVDYFDVDKRRNNEGWTSVYDSGTNTSITIAPPAEGDYRFRVRGCRRVGSTTLCSDFRESSSVSLRRPASLPAVSGPSGDGDGRFEVTWNSIPSTTYYRVQEQVNQGAWVTLRDHDTNRSSSTVIARQVSDNASYHYRVAACNAVACAADSSIRTVDVAFAAGQPGEIAVPGEHGSATLSLNWGAASGRVTSYQLQQQKDGGSWQSVVSQNVLSHLLSSLSAGNYRFRVRGCNQVGSFNNCAGDWRTSAETVLRVPSTAPEITAPVFDSDGDFQVSWSNTEITHQFRLQERAGDGAWQNITTQGASNRSYDFTSKAAQTYSYRVQSCNSFGCGSFSPIHVLRVARLADDAWANTTLAEIDDHPPTPFTPTEHDATVGVVPGEGSVSGGQASYRVPIVIPPGRAGMQPNLSIIYSSNGGNGSLGMGFSLTGLSGITRCPRTLSHDGFAGSVQYRQDTDRLCLDGQRLIAVSGTYGADGAEYRTELDAFARIRQNGSLNNAGYTHFAVELKNGRVRYYGKTADSRVIPEGASVTAAWLINQEYDRTITGNSIHYLYRDYGRGEVLIENIYYTGAANSQGDRRVFFDYEERSDFSSEYRAGGVSAQTQRLDTVTTYYQQSRVLEYDLDYLQSQASARSLLEVITLCGFEEGKRVCRPETKFDWHHASPQFVLEPIGYRAASTVEPFSEGGQIVAQLQDRRDLSKILPFGDVNGDGTRDWPTWFNDAEGRYVGNNNAAERSCRRTKGHTYLCVDGDFNRDGRTDAWRTRDDRLEISYNATASGGGDWIRTGIDTTGTTGFDGVHSVGDYNRDGWPDLVMDQFSSFVDGTPRQLKLFLHSGNLSSPYGGSGIVMFTYNQGRPRTESGYGGAYYGNDVQLVGDINGDGLPDLLVFNIGSVTGIRYASYWVFTELNVQRIPSFNSRHSIVAHRNSLPVADELASDLRDFDYFMDVNGDGLPDWIAWVNSSRLWLSLNRGDGSFGVWQNLGADATLAARNIPIQWAGEPVDTTSPLYAHALRNVDIDGDGRPELLVPDERLNTICLKRLVVSELKDICGDSIFNAYNVLGGTTTISRSIELDKYDAHLYRYKAYHFVEDADGSLRVESRPTELIGAGNQSAGVDAFGNGLQDFVFVAGCAENDDLCNRSSGANDISDGVYVNRNRGSATGDQRYQPVDMLAGATNGFDFHNEWDYRPLASRDTHFHTGDKHFYAPDFTYLDSLSATERQKQFHFASSMYVVAEHRKSNGVSGLNAERYRYKGAMYDSQGRGFLGFRSVTVEAASGLVSHTQFHQRFPLTGKIYKRSLFTNTDNISDAAIGSTTPVNETVNHYIIGETGGASLTGLMEITSPLQAWTAALGKRYFTGTSKEAASFYTLQNRAKTHESTVTRSFDGYGNVTNQASLYQEPGEQHQVQSDVATIYDADISNWFLDRLDRQTATVQPVAARSGVAIEAGDDTLKTVLKVYTEWDARARKPGQVTTTPSSGQSSVERFTYNDDGLLASATANPSRDDSRHSTYYYSDDGYFNDELHNTYGHVQASHTDPKFGGPLWQDDQNGNRVTTSYDAFGAAVSAYADGVVPVAYSAMRDCREHCAEPLAVYTLTREQEGTPTALEYYDRMGRMIRSEIEGFSADQTIVTTQTFNARGLVIFKSAPRFAGESVYGTRYTDYDALGRLLAKSVDQTNSQTLETGYTYDQGDGFTTNIIAGSLSLSRTTNGLGQLTQTVDAIGGFTRYAYDGAGNPIVIEDANGSRITSTYNALGQKTALEDPNLGNASYTFNTYGDLATTTDANGDVIGLFYDRIGRSTLREVNNLEESEWVYDTAPQGLGLLHIERRLDQAFSREYRYDSFSREEASTTTIDGQGFTIEREYDTYHGRVKGLRYPGGLTLRYRYNARGYQSAIDNAASGYVYQEISAMDAFGQWKQSSIASGTVAAARDFYQATGQFADTEYRNVTAILHRQAFNEYDIYGNLERVELEIPSASASLITETYSYDDLHRLERNTRTGSADITYGYDAVGNLEEKSDFASTYRYEGGKPNAVSSITKTNGAVVAFAYDNNGNRTHENGNQQLWYNAYNKPTRISRHGSTLTFDYGADQVRYKQVDSTQQKTTLYVDKLFEQITEDDRIKHRLFISDVAVLTMERADGTYLDPSIGFTHRDRLGSTVAITDHLGVLRETHSFDPFGKPRMGASHDKPIPILASDITTRGFTDHEHLDAVQLIHMNGRGYDYSLGRFLSVDPLIQSPQNSQSVNPYSYIMNNPLSGTDPTGYKSETLKKEIGIKYSPRTGSRIGRTETVTVTETSNGSISMSGGTLASQAAVWGMVASKLGELSSRANLGSTSNAGGDVSDQQGSDPHGLIDSDEAWANRTDVAMSVDHRLDLRVERFEKGEIDRDEFLEEIQSEGEAGMMAVGPPGVGLGAKAAVTAVKGIRTARAANGLAGLSKAQAKIALKSAQEAKKGSTVVGHALSKHAGRNPEIWGKMTGSMKTWNGQAMKHFREIMRGGGNFKEVTSNGRNFLEKRLDDGRGIRLNMDHTFKTFID